MNSDLNIKKIAFIAVTEKGKALAYELKQLIGSGEIYVSKKLAGEGSISFGESLKVEVGKLFKNYEALVFIMATGIVVRSIAPYIESKFTDPAIVVLDEQGQNVISLLSGHMGGANELTRFISEAISAHAVITTSTDINEVAALDNIAKKMHGYIADFRESVKEVNYALVHHEKIGLYIQDVPEYEIDQRGFIVLEQIDLARGIGVSKASGQAVLLNELKILVYITRKQLKILENQDIIERAKLPRIIKVVPRDLTLGMGCKRNTLSTHFINSFYQFMDENDIDANAIYKVGSIDLKKDEKAMQDLAHMLKVPFEIIDRKEVLEVEDLFEKSEFVKKNVGVYSVAEPVAYLLSGRQLVVHKAKIAGTTWAVGKTVKR
nr:cobalt-precorrin 5A hydrolase [uncultured Cellulosilyticum sp.]